MLLRFARLCAAAGALVLAVLLNLAFAQLSAAQPSADQPLPNAAMNASVDLPIATSTVEPDDWFSATAVLTTSAAALAVRDALTVTAQLVTTGTCGFAIYDVTLTQVEPLFTHVDPADNVIGPPGENPAIWRLAASRSGVTTFTVSFYGETYCDGVWSWTSVRSDPLEVTVAPVRVGLPFVSRNVPPVPVTELGTLGGGRSNAQAINNRGEVVGFSLTAAGQGHAFLWQSGVMTDLGTLGGASVATAINEHGQVVGYSSPVPMAYEHAIIWADGEMTDIGGAAGAVTSFALDINLQGQVLVYAPANSSGSFGSFVWADGVITDLGTLGGYGTIAIDINDRGQVVGSSAPAGGRDRAVLWQEGVLTDINPPNAAASNATAINERGQVAGYYEQPTGIQRGFLWEGGVVTTFGSPFGDVYRVDALNERGEVAGVYSSGVGLNHFLWSKDKGLTDLGPTPMNRFYCRTLLSDNSTLVVLDSPNGPLLWRDGDITPLGSLPHSNLNCPTAINDNGQIVGSSIDANGEYHAVLWEVSE